MSDRWQEMREQMVREQIAARGVRDPGVLAAMREVPRHLFVDPIARTEAYEDRPLPIGLGQTISQPFMVAYMVEALRASGQRVLEVGTGSGYETAILSQLAAEVFTVEVEPQLSRCAQGVLEAFGIRNVHFRVGDGMAGWPEAAPFMRIVLTAGVENVPRPLLDQLEVGGRFLGPVGSLDEQRLVQIMRTRKGLESSELMPVVFVPAHSAPVELSSYEIRKEKEGERK